MYVITYDDSMTAAEFRTTLKKQLDAAEQGMTITIVRGGVVFELKKVAE